MPIITGSGVDQDLTKKNPNASVEVPLGLGCRFAKAVKPGSARSARGKPLPFGSVEPWHDRHQVSHSKDNARLPRQKRDYFDHLPGLRVAHGEYREVPRHFATNFDTFASTSAGDIQAQLGKRFDSYPITDMHVQWVDKKNAQETVLALETGPQVLTPSVETFAEPVPVNMILKAMPSSHKSSRNSGSGPVKAGKGGGKNQKKAPTKKLSILNEHSQELFLQISGQEPVREFWEWSKKTFGSAVQCWKALDDNADMTVSRAEFFKGLADLKYPGDVKALWRMLDRDHSNTVSFLHFDPEAAMDLAMFKQWVAGVFGSVEDLGKALDTDRNGKLDLDEFKECCEKHNFQPKSRVVAIFRTIGYLGKMDEEGNVLLRSMIFLDHWDVPEYLIAQPDDAGAEWWKQVLLAKYKGNAMAAWRKLLDKDGSMRLNFLDFKTALKAAHVKVPEKHTFAGIWRSLDKHLKGWLSLHEFDEKASDDLKKLKSFGTEAYGGCQRLCEQISAKGNRVPRTIFKMCLKRAGVFTQNKAPDEAQPAMGAGRDRKRRTTLLEMEMEQIDVIFSALDIENAGVLTSRQLKFLDEWNVKEEEAEIEGWIRLQEYRRRNRRAGEAKDSDVDDDLQTI